MTNYAVLIGRIVSDMKVSKDDTLDVVLAIPRSYKNADGEYTTDFIDCKLCSELATNTVDYCRRGDLVAIKGSLEKEDGVMFVKAEKISFLASNKSKDEK